MLIHKVFRVSVVAMAVLFIAGCEKDTADDVSTVLKVPSIELIGGDYISVPVGASFSDAGAKYTGEDGSVTDLQAVSNPVNTSQPGLYFLSYEQTSTSGIFETQATRVVAVSYQENPVDYSGTYTRESNGVEATVTRVAPGLYRVQNPGGSGGHEVVVVYFIETGANTFVGPLQPNEYVGDIEITDINFTSTGASWKIINNPFYLENVRTFVKN